MTPATRALPAPLARGLDGLRARLRFRFVLEACLLSYPKCGRTWLRLLIGEAVRTQFGVAVDDPTDVLAITRAVDGVATLEAFHDDNPMWKEVEELETDKRRYRRKRVILLVRDPRDVAVSSYYHHTRRTREFEGDLGAFLAEKRIVEKVCRFYRIWHRQQHRVGALLLVRYEDLHRDPAGQLRRVLRFLGVEDPDPRAIAHAVEAGAFSRMRAIEAAGGFGNARLRPGAADDPASFKTRRGEVGGFRRELSAEQAAEATAIVRSLLGPAFGYPHEEYDGSAPPES